MAGQNTSVHAMCDCNFAHCCRWDVFVCSTAETRYAQLAWMLLSAMFDPQGWLFPQEETRWRLLTVPANQKKDLLEVLRKKTEEVVGRAPTNDAGEGRQMAGQ